MLRPSPTTLLLLALLTPVAGLPCPKGETPSRPPRTNLILLVTDDHPFDALGCAGHPVLETPHMDALAERGARFTHAFATTPICAASRATLLTGRYERSHGYTFGQPPLDAATLEASYPRALRAAGYRVGFVGKLGVNVPAEARAELFDVFAPGTYPYFRADAADPSRHLTEINVDSALEFLRTSGEGPFFLSLSLQAPHAEDHNPAQYVWPESCNDLYVDSKIPPPRNADPAFFEALSEFLRTGLNRERWHWRFDTVEKREAMVRGYFRMLSGVDMGIGRIVAALDELGLSDTTAIVLIGDNGYFLGERGYAGKWTMHDRSTRVPLIVVDPRRKDSVAVDAFALNIDIAPTLLALAGVDAPPAMQGRSLLPLLADPNAPWRTEVFTERLWRNPRIPRTEGLRTESFKYIRYLYHLDFEELYDLALDPDEANNLAALESSAEGLTELRVRCAAAAAAAR